MCGHVVSSCLPSEEMSDQTDYDEEAVESALSDFEAFIPHSEQAEGETADTAETVCRKTMLFLF